MSIKPFCNTCKGTGETGHYGILDCAEPGCTAAVDRAAMNTHLDALGPLSDYDRAWEACRFGMELLRASQKKLEDS